MNTYLLMIIFLCGGITFCIRALPFLIFTDKKQLPLKVKQLGDILPPAIMAVLVIYCLKDMKSSFLTNGIFEIICVAIVAVSYKIKHNTLLSLILGTVCYMFLIRFFS